MNKNNQDSKFPDQSAGTGISHKAEKGLSGTVRLPGDKSISHRAILLGALAEGETIVSGLLEGEDVLRSATAMRTLGVEIEKDYIGENDPNSGPVWSIGGGLLQCKPENPVSLYFGNAGTGVRLAMGLIAGCGVAANFDGDQSLRARPMARITDPLKSMGLEVECHEGKLPVCFKAENTLSAIRYRLPVASAQIKSAILLAGLNAKGTTIIEEPVRSRDHTENMLAAFGVSLSVVDDPQTGRELHLEGGQTLRGTHIEVPGDPSSAAFLMVAALIVPGSDITLKQVMMNPLRTALFDTLIEMGGDISYHHERDAGGEPVADIRVRYSALKGITVPAERAPSMIDEYPVLAIAASFAKGDTMMKGIGEMRVKESDRIAAIEAGLRANGVEVESGEDWLNVTGAKTVDGGGCALTHHDHRIAMSFLVLGLATQKPVQVDDMSMIATSFPGFTDLMQGIGARIEG